MTTHSSGTIEWPREGVHSSHSAPPHSGEPPAEDPNASGRARAREYAPESAQSQPDSAPAPENPPAVTFSDWAADLVGFITPPDIVTEDRPSLQKALAYANRGEWTGEDGLPRLAGRVYCWAVALPVKTALYLLDWIFERPARLAAAVLLYGLAAQFTPLPSP